MLSIQAGLYGTNFNIFLLSLSFSLSKKVSDNICNIANA